MKTDICFFDIDGTLISHTTKEMPESTKKSLRALRAKGIETWIATGRPRPFLPEFEPGLFSGILSSNGQVLEHEGKRFSVVTLSPEAVAGLIQNAKKEGIPFVAGTPDAAFNVFGSSDALVRYCGQVDRYHPIKPEELVKLPVTQVCAGINWQEADRLIGNVDGADATWWCDWGIDIIPKGAGKDAGVRGALDYLHLLADNAMAFGDGVNDIPMLKACKTGVAMGNAQEEVFPEADYITETLEEDGLAKALVHFGVLSEEEAGLA